ncbi:MAG TPA: hypothetical protein VFE05_08355 [Longimicrobiaceae bacterium]|jgi:hypothetical protein|nr:hypothetical protein [Longimicrobiaceae bacterium]
MKATARFLSMVLVPLLLAACGGGGGTDGPPTGNTKASLAVTISGLPSGAAGSVTVAGPAGFSRTITSSETLSNLEPGAYTLTTANVSAGGGTYATELGVQTVNLAASAHESVTVAYRSLAASLTVNVAGLSNKTGPSVTVTGPGGYTKTVTSAQTTLFGLAAGTYTLTATGVAATDSTFQPRPSVTTVNVAGDAPASTTVTYASVGPAALNLTVGGAYFVQSVQKLDNSVALVQGRDALLRVFVKADQNNTASPNLRIRVTNGAAVLQDVTMPAPALGVPASLDQTSLAGSYNINLPAAQVQPGLAVLVTVDPDNLVRESNEADQTFPAAGTPQIQNVRLVPTLAVRLVPIKHENTALVGGVNAGNMDQFLSVVKKIWPIAAYDGDVHAVYTTGLAPLESAGGGWDQLLQEINALRVAEGTNRYYYGVMHTNYQFGVVGLGYIGQLKTAIGWDSGTDAYYTLAHEMGHNFGRRHAPSLGNTCGTPSGIDTGFPYINGHIGGFGYDQAEGLVKDTSFADIMGYCNNQWVSDYNYNAVMDYMTGVSQSNVGTGASVQPTVLVWGRMSGDKLVLEPAFGIYTRPTLPTQGGAYTVQGLDANGGTLFSLNFAGTEVADLPGGAREFAFAVPLSAAQQGRLASVRLTAAGKTAAVQTSRTATAGGGPRTLTETPDVDPSASLRRVSAGQLRFTWDVQAHPMVMVRDPESGEILSFARNGRATLNTRVGALEMVYSDGVRSSSVRMQAQ